ncbi:hypothetical protein jhhlp_000802 [Lomentospora prolificans]|uniref:RTA1 domain protein n=1 Tax=Lomentospora prolificans TaxID=41688 RepID=A0A2N3NJJ6_9PEZI|nr:hypothetical protein jhhlp_000802 [Lomentospora prolificans]
MPRGFAACVEVTPACPVEATTYGYYPSLGPNAALLAVYAVLFFAQIIMGFMTKVYFFSAAIAAGCFLEALGYGGRIIMHNNPWSDSGMRIQIVCLIIGPSFIAGGIYLTLKHFIRLNGPEHSRLRPNLYTWIFIGCDIGSICLQAIGGGLAGSAKDNRDLLEAGNNVIIAGIAFQVATMVFCGILTVDYSIRRYRNRAAKSHIKTKGAGAKAMLFQAGVAFAYLTVLIRCIYRLPEMAGGWGNPRMRNETEFLILDGLMIALASATLTIFHPGYFYPYMRTGYVDMSDGTQLSSVELSSPSIISTDPQNRA